MRITAGEFRGRNLLVPKGDHIRPTSDMTRQAIFNILNSGRFLADIDFDLVDAQVIDAFCGTGALGLESLSRGAAGCVFIDKDRASLASAKQNAENFRIESGVHFILKEAAKIGPKPDYIPAANLFFVDPPYRKALIPPALGALAENGWLAPSALGVLESETRIADDELSGLPFDVLDTRPYGDTLVRIVHYTA